MVHPQRTSALALPFVLALTACGSGPGTADVHDPRPSDGLLESPPLQALVEAQERRDAVTLMEGLRAGDPVLKARAAFALGSVQAPTAGPALEALLDDTATAVRRDAAFALGQVGDSAGQLALLAALDREQIAGVRRAVLVALGKAGGGTALARLTERPGGGTLWADRARAMGLLLLADVRYASAADSLASWLAVREPDVRESSAWFFSRLENPVMLGRYREAALAALGTYGLDDPAAMYLVTMLGNAGVEADAPVLLRWLEQARDWRIRANAAAGLAGRVAATPAVAEGLLDALDDASWHVRRAAGEALASVPQDDAVADAVLDHLASDPDEWRDAGPLLRVLSRSGRGRAVLEWIQAFPPDAAGPWSQAAETLMTMGGDAPRDLLARAAASDDPAVSGQAGRALAARWPAERDRAATHEAYWNGFSAAVDGPGTAGLRDVAAVLADSIFVARGSVPLLAAAWSRAAEAGDPSAARAVVAALGATGSPDAEAPLRRALDAPDPAVSDAAARALLALAGGGESPGDDEEEGAPTPGRVLTARDAAARRVDWAFLAELGPRPVLALETDEGLVEVAMVTEEAPLTVQTLARLAADGRLDGVPFHRVLPNFVVQGGDVGRGNGTGGPGFSIPSELTSLRFLRGTAGMARSAKDTEGSQFFLTHSPQPHLDGGYTAFGWVVTGMDVVDRIVQGQRVVRASVHPTR